MKRIIGLFVILVLLFAFFGFGCAVNSTTGGITVLNRTDKDASNIKVGSVTVGFVGKGQSTYVYFFKEENSAQITVEGFTPAGTAAGKINLKLNYSYAMTLSNDGQGYRYNLTSVKIGAKTTDSDYDEDMF